MYNYNINLNPSEILIYLRKSRSDDPMLTVEEVLQRHETILNEWCERNLSDLIPTENRYREVVSGETIEDRPEIKRLLKQIESPGIRAVLIVEVQRLSRGDLEDAGRLIKLFRYTDTLIITPQMTYDLKDEYDRDAFERELKRGNEFLEYQKKIMNRGRLLSVSQGNYIGSLPPYGYEKIWVKEGKSKYPTLKPIPEEAEVVKMIFDMYVNQDMGYQNICHALNDMHIKPPRCEIWSPYSIQSILTNDHYIGKVRWNWRKTVNVVENGEIMKMRQRTKRDDLMIYDGKHEAIISNELFNASIQKSGRNTSVKSTLKVRNPFAGLISCKCGRAMTYRTYLKDGIERAPARLLCDNQAYCKTGSCQYTEMEAKVISILKDSIKDFQIQLKNNDSDKVQQHKKIISNLENKLKDIKNREIAQWEAQAHPDISQRMPVEIFKQLNEKLLKEKAEIEDALYKARTLVPTVFEIEEKLTRFKNALEALENPFVSAQEKNTLLKQCIDKIIYSRLAPIRTKSNAKKVTVNGKRIKPNGLPTGANWTVFPIELDVSLKI